MIPCPICSQAMSSKNSIGRPRVYCSQFCHNQGNSRLIRSRAAEVDEMAVVRLLAGSKVLSTRGERIEAVRVLTGQGRSASWIADYLRTTRRSVERYRHEITNRRAVA